MINETKNDYLRSLSLLLQTKILKLTIIVGISFYVIYLLTQFAIIFTNMSNLHKSEFTYLQTIGISLTLQRQNQMNNFLNFLDSSSKILKYVNLSSSNASCNPDYYLCDYSSSYDYGQYGTMADYLQSNSYMLKETDVYSVLLIAQNTTIMLNVGSINNKTSDANSSLVANFANASSLMVSSASKSYQFTRSSMDTSNFLTFICSNMQVTASITLCIAYKDPIMSTIGENYYKVQNSQISQISANKTIIARMEFIDKVSSLAQQYSFQSPSGIILRCLITYYKTFGKYLKMGQGLPIACKSNQDYLLNFFGPAFLFYSYRKTTELTVPTTRFQSVFQSKVILEIITISSNSSFYSRCANLKTGILINLRETGYLIIVILLISALVINFSEHIIEDILLYSIEFITTLCDYLKNKDEKEFNRLVNRGQLQILNFIVDYFQQFIWIHKLRKFKGKSKYKKLLFQGLELFDKENYIPVLRFIYSQLITIQSALIQKLFKIKQLPHKKREMGSKCQEQEKLIMQDPVEVKVNKRRNANFNLLDPDDDELMKNISVSFRGNRGVRFSNDIQTIQIGEGPILRKAKFSQVQAISCETIKNDLSDADQSVKRSDFNKQSYRSLKSQEESFTSLVDISRGIKKKDSSTKTRSLESIHVDLDNIKLDEEIDDEQLMVDQQSQQDEVYNMTREQITGLIADTYVKLMGYYERLIDLISTIIKEKSEKEIPGLANYLYILTIEKYEKYYELLLFQSQNQIERRERQQIDFQDFKDLELHYNYFLTNELTQQAEVLREGISQAQHFPISLQNLQDVYCRSNNKKVRIAARHLLAIAAQELQPHLDLIIARNVYANLKQEKTTSTVKQESLSIFIRNLQRYTNFREELEQLKMAAQFYNTKNKKFYFLVSISSIKLFTPVLSKFFDLLDNFDIFNIYNLEDEISEPIESQTSENLSMKFKRRVASDKIKYLTDLQGFIESFNFASGDKIKQALEKKANSVKTISKKRIYEKQFHQILMSIENDEVEYSKYIVIFLGDEHSISSGDTQESSSSANHRPYQQKIHLEISKVIEKGYMHFILVGYQLDSYPSKYGRLKKYVKLSPQLFQVELSAKEQQENLRRLEKYLQ